MRETVAGAKLGLCEDWGDEVGRRDKKTKKRESLLFQPNPLGCLFTKGPRNSCICDNMDGHEDITLSEISQTEKDKACMVSLSGAGLKKIGRGG